MLFVGLLGALPAFAFDSSLTVTGRVTAVSVHEGFVYLQSDSEFSVASASGGADAERHCREKGFPDVVVMDVMMPEMDGFATIERLRRFDPKVKVLLLSGMPHKADEDRARELKICGYLPKSVPWRRLVSALHEIAVIIGISAETVKTHAKSVMRKLDAVNNVSAVARAYELGILRA